MSLTELTPIAGSAPRARRRTGRSLVVTPAVVAHRGASGYRPEHTAGAYRTAIRLGVDDLEVDVVLTRDGVLVARHENELSASTDIADHPELADRRTTRTVDGQEINGWFSEDLDLAEIRTLRARERFAGLRGHNTAHDGTEQILTLDEVLRLARAESVRRGRGVGVMIELKHAAHFAASGRGLEGPLLADLGRHGLDHARSRVTVMSFDREVLRRVAARTTVAIVQLLDAVVTPAELDRIDEYADGIGPHKSLLLGDSSLVREAHRRWLGVYAWTLRAENRFLPPELRSGPDPAAFGDLATEARRLLDAGVDGLITDHPDVVLLERCAWLDQPSGNRIQAIR